MTADSSNNDGVDNSTAINKFNIINVIAYLLNVFVTFAIGMGWIDLFPGNGELSLKYQTIVTPAGWAFSIWSLIFIWQAFWMIWQLLPNQRNRQGVYGVGYGYLIVTLFQAGWTLSFGYEIIWLSLIAMVALCIALHWLVAELQKYDKIWKGYFLWQFPFSLHAGWITAATAVNVNVVLVAYGASVGSQLGMAAVSLLALLAIAVWFLMQYPTDFTIPAVLVWALGAVYAELQNPKTTILQRFSTEQIQGIQYASLAGLAVILVGILLKTVYLLVYQRPRASAEHSSNPEKVDNATAESIL